MLPSKPTDSFDYNICIQGNNTKSCTCTFNAVITIVVITLTIIAMRPPTNKTSNGHVHSGTVPEVKTHVTCTKEWMSE